jgi:two-component system phosphate regulon sensor histidine kinase PhoR
LLSSLVNDLRARQSAKSNYRNHQWRWELPESRETIQGNGEYIQRAMQNVLDNAVDYTPEGGTISVQIFEQDQWAVFEVLDTGIGITNDDMPRVGHDFFRADAAQERQHASPGLGLSIVRQIMHRHHGAILMESVPGQGTRVQLIWPTNSDWMPLEPEIPAQMLGDPSPFTRDTREQEEIILE